MVTIVMSVFVSLLAITAYAYCEYQDKKSLKEQN